jgi:glutamyl-tRNA reductase
LFLIDISVPRNIDPDVQQLDGVYLYNIDDLEAIVRENVRSREQELTACEQIVDARAVALMTKLNLEKERLYDVRIQPQPGWVSDSAAVLGG